jgi:hypothetical protein
MTSQHYPTLSRFERVRLRVWFLLLGSLLVASAMPLLTLWHAASSPLTAQVCLASQTRETVQLVVSMPDATDRDAVAGPWAHLHVVWDMVTMPMSTRPIDLAGTAAQSGTFAVPLQVPMPGPWWADLTLQTPGRPDWHTHIHFTVASPGDEPQPTASPGGGVSVPSCGLIRYEKKSGL